MEQIDKNILDAIYVPEGIEERLSSKIDIWAREEHNLQIILRPKSHWCVSISAVAAISILAVLGALLLHKSTSKGMIDTFDDPKMAYIETTKILQMLSEELSLGSAKISEIEEFYANPDSIFSSTIKLISE